MGTRQQSRENSDRQSQVLRFPSPFCFPLVCRHSVRESRISGFLQGSYTPGLSQLLDYLSSFLFPLDRQLNQLFWWKYMIHRKKNSGSVGRQHAKKIAGGLQAPSSTSHGETTLFKNLILYWNPTIHYFKSGQLNRSLVVNPSSPVSFHFDECPGSWVIRFSPDCQSHV